MEHRTTRYIETVRLDLRVTSAGTNIPGW